MQCPEDMHSYCLFLPAVRLMLLSDPCRCFVIYTCSLTSVGINVGVRVYLYRWICSNINCNNMQMLGNTSLLFCLSMCFPLKKGNK